ncbi:SRPBCC family protein [Miltoncostaea marina]|uniref:SRPBCC family protein n=1 Tax=Miltoncostaea marina TaxID=2843215 RepID=UPI001C3DC81C|nr:SRPBCC family protein [Miltoncostaea marina]
MTRTADRHGSATVELVGDRELIITRRFDAPARLVVRALTEPDLVRRWWGFEGSEWLACEIDPRVGGRWRFVTRDGGVEVAFRGEFLELEPPHRIVQTELYEGIPGATDADAAVNTTTLEEREGVTTMTVHCRYARPEHRDGLVRSGMEGGMQVSYDRMEDLLAGLAAG